MDHFADHLKAEQARKLAAQVDGLHYTSYVPEVKALLKAGDLDAAAGLLLRLIDAVEREAAIPIAGVPGVPKWYFDRLSTIYRRCGNERARGQLQQRFALLDAKVVAQSTILLRAMRKQAGAG